MNSIHQPSNKMIEEFFEGLTTIDYLIVSPTVALNCLEPAKISFYNSHSASIHFVAHDQDRNLTVLSKLIHHYIHIPPNCPPRQFQRKGQFPSFIPEARQQFMQLSSQCE